MTNWRAQAWKGAFYLTSESRYKAKDFLVSAAFLIPSCSPEYPIYFNVFPLYLNNCFPTLLKKKKPWPVKKRYATAKAARIYKHSLPRHLPTQWCMSLQLSLALSTNCYWNKVASPCLQQPRGCTGADTVWSFKVFISPIRGRSAFLEPKERPNVISKHFFFTANWCIRSQLSKALQHMFCCVKLTLHKSLNKSDLLGYSHP